MSLADYAPAEGTSGCWTCALPDAVRAEVEANEAKPKHARVPRRQVVKYLKQEHGLHCSTDSLYKHFAFHMEPSQ